MTKLEKGEREGGKESEREMREKARGSFFEILSARCLYQNKQNVLHHNNTNNNIC